MILRILSRLEFEITLTAAFCICHFLHMMLSKAALLSLQGAVAEAAFMTGVERNSEVVQLAAYAPLLANVNHKGALCPTNLIIYDNHRCPECPLFLSVPSSPASEVY